MKKALCPYFQEDCIGDECLSFSRDWRVIDIFEEHGTDTFQGDAFPWFRPWSIKTKEPYCRALKTFIPWSEQGAEFEYCYYCKDKVTKKFIVCDVNHIPNTVWLPTPICNDCIEKVKNKQLNPYEPRTKR